jgi:D-lactate dehydrogenase (cytochrome)
MGGSPALPVPPECGLRYGRGGPPYDASRLSRGRYRGILKVVGSTNQLTLRDVLGAEEYRAIDAFCRQYPYPAGLDAVSRFTSEQFNTELVTDPDIVAGFVTDSSNLPGRAEAVARPASERECAVVLRTCFAAGIPCTVSAGRSSLTGSATADGGIVLSTVKMQDPTPTVDEEERKVRAPVGMILEDLRKDVTRQTDGRLEFPVNPTSRTDAAVGGALACNASGFTPGDIGAIRAWVESLDLLLPSGRSVRARRGQYISQNGHFLLATGTERTVWPLPHYARPAIKNASGPFSSPDGRLDFVDLVVGSEGLFGMVTACTLRLQPAPSEYLDLFFSLPAEQNALAFRDYLETRLAGGLGALTALEYFGVDCRRFMEHEQRFFRGDNPVAVYVQVPLSGVAAEDAAEQWLQIVAESGCGIDQDAIILLDNDRDRAVFLEARHSMPANAIEVVQRRGTFTIMTDTVVPPDRFAGFLDSTHSRIRAAGVDYLSFGHLGDCHLHFTLLPTKEQLARAAALYDDIIAASADSGGVYSGEHGTGKRKRRDFVRCYGSGAVEEIKRCKAAVDPQFLLNRGNVIEYP